MPQFTFDDRQMLQETHDDVRTLLERVGANGTGLGGRMLDVESTQQKHADAIHKIHMILAFAAGGGGLAGSIVGVLKLLGT
jgi:hypothetical protein